MGGEVREGRWVLKDGGERQAGGGKKGGRGIERGSPILDNSVAMNRVE